jgi:hypothetical protein
MNDKTGAVKTADSLDHFLRKDGRLQASHHDEQPDKHQQQRPIDFAVDLFGL